MKMHRMNLKTVLSLCLCTALLLSGCQSTEGKERYRQAIESRQQITQENAAEAVELYERLYTRNAGDTEIAVKYAEALRKSGRPQQALTVLQPLADLQQNREPEMLLEYTAVNIALGRFMHAEHALSRFASLSEEQKKNHMPQALNLEGLILSAGGHHEEAEEKYRTALAEWSGDPSPVMNNLALCLAQQGAFDEAVELLREARLISPDGRMQQQNLILVEKLRAQAEGR
ncbi:MAG: hypothetical protein EA357_07030 [Micavibrio sp.]|nr:MAG: hypothetical protein EA357_07030 [Micavibrio sp.]